MIETNLKLSSVKNTKSIYETIIVNLLEFNQCMWWKIHRGILDGMFKLFLLGNRDEDGKFMWEQG